MSTADSPRKPLKSKRAEKRATQPRSNPNERLKTIVRRLPPNLPEDIFWQSVQTWVSDETATWKFFYPGKLRKKANKENIHSRAYIAFKTEELVAKFSREYDGHIFRDKAGNESQAVVEFAPYQKIPPLEKKRPDNRIGTIDKDDDFIAFLQALESSATKPYDAEQLLENLIASTAPHPQPTSTPLLEALKAEKSAQKDKEAILRNHPHYKDSKKDDGKKKGNVAANSSKAAPDSTATIGKKAAKKAAAQKTTQTQAKSTASSSSTARPANKAPAEPSTPKSGRGARQQQQQQQQQQAQPDQPSASTTPTPNATATPSDAATPTPTQPTGSARRVRPMLGLASRQFEAALSGAGVQKAKRERQHGGDASEPSQTGKGKEKEGKPKTEASSSASKSVPVIAPVTPVAPPTQAGMLPAPAILQRETKQQSRRGGGGPRSADDGGSSRGPARGRGKGRGRGGGAPRDG
ncbi:Smg-4/UPF3 family-domain-containing protein [Amylostereum chailletii]|nr:Smg-4/UPF3 family-domain-containing protein [Amylostereum chailletii]